MGIKGTSPPKKKLDMEKILEASKTHGVTENEMKQQEKINKLENRVKTLEAKFRKIKLIKK